MSNYQSIDEYAAIVGNPITREIMLKIIRNFEDHEQRLGGVEVASGGVTEVFNGDIHLDGLDVSDPHVFYYKVSRIMSITDFRIQLFSKQGITSGNLDIDLHKSTDTNNANFSSILTEAKRFSFSTASDYAESVASIDSSKSALLVGNVLRITVSSVPPGFTGKILVRIGAE